MATSGHRFFPISATDLSLEFEAYAISLLSWSLKTIWTGLMDLHSHNSLEEFFKEIHKSQWKYLKKIVSHSRTPSLPFIPLQSLCRFIHFFVKTICRAVYKYENLRFYYQPRDTCILHIIKYKLMVYYFL